MQHSNEKEFWSVGLSRTGEWQIRTTPSDKQPAIGEDSLVEILKGDISDVKLEFNGYFYRDYTKENFLLITEDVPWMFVLLENGDLYAKKCLDTQSETLTLIAVNVSKMFPCRSWVSDENNVDSGLYLAYISEGIGYFALYHKVQEVLVWEPGFRIDEDDTDTNKNEIKVFRLNDYRTAIFVGSPTSKKLYLTARNYIGGTFSNQSFKEEISAVNFVMLNPYRITDPDPKLDLNPILNLENNNGISKVRLHTSFPFVYWDKRFPTFNNPPGYQFTAAEIDESTGDILLTLDSYIPSPHASLTFTSNEFNRLRYKVTDYCQPTLPAMTFQLGGDWHESFNDTHFNLAVGSITASFVAVKKRNLYALYEELFSIETTSMESSIVSAKKGSFSSETSEAFLLGVGSIRGSMIWSYSGSIIT